MTDKSHYFAVIRPTRPDFLTNPSEEDNKLMSEHFQYNTPHKQKWIEDLIKKLEDEPENAWLIEIIPNKIYSYD